MVKKITFNLENFHYNVIIANFHQIYSFFQKIIQEEDFSIELLKNNYLKILKIMYPVIPHLISECLTKFKYKDFPDWPKIENISKKKEEYVELVIQINGKKRGISKFKHDFTEDEILEKIKNEKEYQKYFESKNVIKKFYVKNKLINFLIK